MVDRLKKLLFIIAAILLLAAIGTAFPSIPTYDPGGIPNIPSAAGPSSSGSTQSGVYHNNTTNSQPDLNPVFGNWPPAQTPSESPNSGYGTSSGQDHPAEAPDADVPADAPAANTGNVVANLGNEQVLSSQEVISAFGSEPKADSINSDGIGSNPYYNYPQEAIYAPQTPTGIQNRIFYMGKWTQWPSGVFLGQQLNTMVNNDQLQYIWAHDSNTWPNWTFWGYRGPGFIPSSFYADKKGWHRCTIWGSVSGFSNTLLIYVW